MRLLEARGARAYYDARLTPGSPCDRNLQFWISTVDAVIVLLSQDAARSRYVASEVWLADHLNHSEGRPSIIPIVLPGFDWRDIDGPLVVAAGLHYLRWGEQTLDQLADDIYIAATSHTQTARRSCPAGLELDDHFDRVVAHTARIGLEISRSGCDPEVILDFIAREFTALRASLESFANGVGRWLGSDPSQQDRDDCALLVRRVLEIPEELAGRSATVAPEPSVGRAVELHLNELSAQCGAILEDVARQLEAPHPRSRAMGETATIDELRGTSKLNLRKRNRYSDFIWMVSDAAPRAPELADRLESREPDDAAYAVAARGVLSTHLDLLQHAPWWDRIAQGRLQSDLMNHGPLNEIATVACRIIELSHDPVIQPWAEIQDEVDSTWRTDPERAVLYRTLALNHQHGEIREQALGLLVAKDRWDLFTIARTPRPLYEVARSLAVGESTDRLKLMADLKLGRLAREGGYLSPEDLLWLQRLALLFSHTPELLVDPDRADVISAFVSRINTQIGPNATLLLEFQEFLTQLGRSDGYATGSGDDGEQLHRLYGVFDTSGDRSKSLLIQSDASGRYEPHIVAQTDEDLIDCVVDNIQGPADAIRLLGYRSAAGRLVTRVLDVKRLSINREVRIQGLANPNCPGTLARRVAVDKRLIDVVRSRGSASSSVLQVLAERLRAL